MMTHFTTSTVADGSPLAIYDWAAAPAFDPLTDAALLAAVRARLAAAQA